MPFLSQLEVRETPDNRWELLADLRYQGGDCEFVVPSGYVSDFTSVPQLFLWLIPRSGRYTKAAVLHDWLIDEANAGAISRCDADGMFRRAMRELDVSLLRRWLMWTGVRWAAPTRIHECGAAKLAAMLALSLIFVIPAVFVGVPTFLLLFVFYLVEWVAYAVAHLAGYPSARPMFVWWAQPRHRGLELPG